MARKKSGKPAKPVDKQSKLAHTNVVLQLSGNNELMMPAATTLVDLDRGDAAILDRIELSGEDARRLMELGFLPGTRITAGLSAPGGDPRVFQVDGSEVALRRETARKLKVRLSSKPRN